MTPTAAMQASTTLLAQLATPAARALVLAGAAGLGLAAFHVKATAVRLITWSAVLYAALAMPLLAWILPPLPVPTPAFLQRSFLSYSWFQLKSAEPASRRVETMQTIAGRIESKHESETVSSSVIRNEERTARNAMPVRSRTIHTSPVIHARVGIPELQNEVQQSEVQQNLARSFVSIPWTTIAAALYLSVACFFLLRFFVGLAFSRRLLRASQRIDDLQLAGRLAAQARALELAFTPRAAESELISVPVTTGALRSTILLPTGWRQWDDAKLDAVIAHELSHIARRDGLTQRVSLLHRAIFWFSPLAWWLDHHLADLAEQASDEAALSSGADRTHYARTLLEFFEALRAAPGRVWWQGVAMAKGGQAERQAEQRLERILHWKGTVAMGLPSSFKKSIAIAVIVLAIPVIYLAAAAHVVYDSNAQFMHPPLLAQDQTAPPAPPAPEARPDARPYAPPEPDPKSRTYSYNAVSPVASISAITPSPAATWSWSSQSASSASPATSASRGSRGRRHSYSYASGYDDDQRFVIASGKSDTLTMSGDMEDAEHVEKLRKTIPGDFIWFQRDEKSYIIRDQATIDRARKLWEPQEELGRKQEALGKQQEALGKQQEELGEKMEQIHVNVPDMTADLDKLKAELKQLSSSATMEQIGNIQSEIGELQSKIGDLQSKAGEQQSKLGDEMSVLGEKQGKLGEEQGKVGEQQGELAQQASRQMKQLLDEALTKGTAQPEP